MSVINAVPLLAAAGGDYTISRSVRLRSSASAYFNRTPAGAGTSNKTFTYSAWVKRGSLGSIQNLISSPNTGNSDSLRFSAADALEYNWQDTVVGQVTTTQVFRDPSAWYHIMFAMDTTQATASNRFKLYVNGVQVTAFSTANYPAQNTVVNNTAAVATKLGQYANASTQNFDGYLTEINFIDGQALTPTSFGQFNSVTGVWQPLKYTGTYGTNGFYLNFSDNSNNTATTIGKDYSGNGNNWTPNNISVTSGATYDSMIDVPTPYADGGNGRGNYCVINPLDVSGSLASSELSNGNLTFTCGSTLHAAGGTFTMPSGKWYWENTVTTLGTAHTIGIALVGQLTSKYYAYVYDGTKYIDNVSQGSYGASYTSGDVIGIAFDADAGTLTFYKNGTSQGTAFTGIASNTWCPFLYVRSSVDNLNFGQRPFTYTPPSGYNALNTQNLPAPTISNGALYMAATTYTGTGATQTISNGNNNTTGVTFKPDFVFTKARSSAIAGLMFDSVRGATKYLQTNSTAAEGTGSDSLTAFASNGFTVGADTSTTGVNQNTTTYVGWQWQAGQGTTSSNTSGSITSTVSVNATAGFSVVTYTGNGSTNQTVGHGLGVAPSMIIIKNRAVSVDWIVYHTSLGATQFLYLNLSTAVTTSSNPFNNTAPTSSVFTIAGNASNNYVNGSGNGMVAYCFSAVRGYSAFGSYTGNGNSSDGPFVYLGFRPRWIMVKRTDAVEGWEILDTSRNTFNAVNSLLEANQSSAEITNTSRDTDYTANGFKVRNASNAMNASGGTYIYAAFAENPFKLALAR